MYEPFLAVLSDVELGAQVVMIKDDAGTMENPEPGCHQEKQIRRIADVDDLEGSTTPDTCRKPEFVIEGCQVLGDVCRWRRCFLQWMAVDVDSIQDFIRSFVATSSRADYADLIARLLQCGRLKPDASVSRYW